MNKLSIFLLRFLPRRLIVWITAMTMGKPRSAGVEVSVS